MTQPRHGSELVPPVPDSALALSEVRLERGKSLRISDSDRDSLLYAFAGSGVLELGGTTESLEAGAAGLVLAGETGRLEAAEGGLSAIVAIVGPEADRHAPIGPREIVSRPSRADPERATGARSFQVLFGPHNGSRRATLFAGFIPPGKAPWHYHLYDEIVWVPEGPGRLHIGESTEELGAGSAFRLRPRQVHIVENPSAETELTVIGIFTPAGSPSAAYLTPGVAAEYRFAG
jgi:quercetin dioxygenase-like cupin family protein